MKNLEFIKQIKDMKSPREICIENNIDYTNLIKGRLKEEKEELVASFLKKQIIEMYDLILFDKIFEEIEQKNGEKTDIL